MRRGGCCGGLGEHDHRAPGGRRRRRWLDCGGGEARGSGRGITQDSVTRRVACATSIMHGFDRGTSQALDDGLGGSQAFGARNHGLGRFTSVLTGGCTRRPGRCTHKGPRRRTHGRCTRGRCAHKGPRRLTHRRCTHHGPRRPTPGLRDVTQRQTREHSGFALESTLLLLLPLQLKQWLRRSLLVRRVKCQRQYGDRSWNLWPHRDHKSLGCGGQIDVGRSAASLRRGLQSSPHAVRNDTRGPSEGRHGAALSPGRRRRWTRSVGLQRQSPRRVRARDRSRQRRGYR